ncbi:hypothetical protein ACJZ2D_003564 [Fusarium nematophilum]
MGNTQSTEAPSRHRKLLKPPVGSHASAAGLPYTATAVTPHHEHFTNSYLAGSLPPPANRASSLSSAPARIGITVSARDHISPLPSPTCRDARRDSTQWSLVVRSQSIQSEQAPRMSSFANSSRASSIVQDGGRLSRQRAESLPIPGQRSSPDFEARFSEPQGLLSPKQKLPSGPVVTNLESHSEGSQDVAEDAKSGSQSAGTSISRTNSDVSLYIPMRRRSVIHAPGVATRAHHSNHPVTAKSSFRHSHPPSPSQPRHSSIESGMARRMSLPSIQSSAPSPRRVTTPTEADYKQLGGMKFGSLRITNGAPVATPVPDNDVTTGWASELERAPPRESYFDDQVHPSTSASEESSTLAAREPMAAQEPVTKTPSPVAEHLSDTDKSRTYESEMSGSGNAGAFPVAEVLDVREDPNAKPSPEKVHPELENKMLKGLARSDSGFTPSPSSESTRQTVTKVDSGYSSNVSLRSLPSLRSAAADRSAMAPDRMDADVSGMYSPSDSTSTRTSSLAPSQTHGRLPIHLEVPSPSTDDDVSTCPTSPTSPASRTFSFVPGSRMPLSSLRSSRSIEFRQSKSGPITSPLPIIVTDENAEGQVPSPAPSAGSRRKLYRFLSASRQKGPPKVRDVHKIERQAPIILSDADEGRSRLTTGLQPTSQRLGLRGEPSKDTLHTILSVGSQDAQTGRAKDGPLGGSKSEAPKKISRRQSWRMSIASMFGSRRSSNDHNPHNETQAAQAVQSVQKHPASAAGHSAATPNPTRSSRAVRNRSPRQVSKKPTGSSGNLPSPTKRTAVRPAPRERRDKPELAHLRTNVSAPNLPDARRASLGANGELNSALRTKTSPPNQAVVYGMPNVIQRYPDIYVTSPAAGYSVHRRASSQGSLQNNNNPPFRVLHSYNSPSYRGAPVWS